MATKKTKKPKKLTKKQILKLYRRWEKKADKALSEYVRERTKKMYGNCPLCEKKPVQCCFHFISRRRKILRWDARNVVGACHTCNYVEQNWPDLSRAWFIKKYGVDLYLSLVEESKQSFIPTQEYLESLVKSYQDLLRKLKEEL